MSVWDALVGQPQAAALLRQAVADAHDPQRSESRGPDASGEATGAGDSMTHAWLITGPPGSGRSVAATAFATALVCPDHGCGQCRSCREAANSAHPDLTIVRPSGVIMGVDDTRALVGRIGVLPVRSDWNVIVIEDADRLNEHADNALLKSLEEPPRHGVWILCAPSADDVLPTIRSRCRVVRLQTPAISAVAEFLQQQGVEPALAAYAARSAQGHIGRARALAMDPEARLRHQRVLRVPSRLGTMAECLAVAGELVAQAKEEAAAAADPIDAAEATDLLRSFGDGATGVRSVRARASSAMKELEREQRNRRRRLVRDELDRVLLDLLGLYRDLLALVTDSRVELINPEQLAELNRMASGTDPAQVLVALDAISHARAALAADGSEDLVFAELAVSLRRAGQGGHRRVP